MPHELTYQLEGREISPDVEDDLSLSIPYELFYSQTEVSESESNYPSLPPLVENEYSLPCLPIVYIWCIFKW